MAKYDHEEIEKRAQKKWAELDLYTTDLTNSEKEPYYLLFEFPYPSGDLHIGHWYAFAVTDIYARYLRMKGKNVLFPIGFDSFGLPAENAAMKNGADPKKWTYENMDRMRSQIRSMGTSVDWSKEVVTSDPSYYKWTQWLFAKLFEHNLAERREAPVKWCPKDQTVLANEQVIDGRCERCGTEVVEKRLTQWFMKITEYPERLLADLDPLPWKEDIKEAQRAWIGKSDGAKLTFQVVPSAESGSEDAAAVPNVSIEVFTTRPDTIYGATYVVLAPEHPLLNELLETLENETDVAAYLELTKRKTERERSENKEKTGVRLEGISAINPATKEQIPIYVADYVLGSYGTGAVMAVPAHDERDFAFATKHTLHIKQVVRPVFGKENQRPDSVRRDTISGFVRSRDGTKVLLLKWKEYEWLTGVIGGIDPGESVHDAAVREVFEETGYRTKPAYISPLTIESHYFADHKNEWRSRIDTPVLLELESEEAAPLSPEEAAKHEARWVPIEEARTAGSFPNNKLALEQSLGLVGAYTGDGVLVDSGDFSGKENREAMWDIVAAVGGKRVTQYRMRDWLVSRQRYWGCPIPIVYDPEGKPHLIPSEHLPWLLPTDVDFKPTGQAPLSTSKELHKRVTKLFGEGWTPEYDTLDTFVDSSWYFLRYLDSKDEHDFSDAALMKKWLPVNRYSGGSEHTTMHLLYARFFHKALYDLALVPTPEPFNERYNRAIILGTDGQKMSKRWGNVVNPDEVVKDFGTDAVRMYLAFIGPYTEAGHYPWNLDGVAAMRKLLERVVALSEKLEDAKTSESVAKMLAKAEYKSAADSERFKFNTALSSLMVLVRDLESFGKVPGGVYQDLLKMLAPFAPHITEELWEKTGGEGSIHASTRPIYDPALLVLETVKVVVQVNGKRRGDVVLSPDASEEDAVAAAGQLPAVEAALGGKDPTRTVYVQGKIVNFVA
jgi:leucyl-tRNA synthetase